MDETRAELFSLIVRLTVAEDRPQAARELARWIGIDDLLVFTRDEQVGAALAAPGLPQTLPVARDWKQFLSQCATGEVQLKKQLISPFTQALTDVTAFSTCDGTVLVTLGGTPDESRVEEILLVLPLIGAALRGERAALHAEGHLRVARESEAQSQALAQALDRARQQLAATLIEARAARERFSFLAEVSLRLSESLDTDTLLRSVVTQVVPRISDCCVVELIDAYGAIGKRVAADAGHADLVLPPPSPPSEAFESTRRHPSLEVIESREPLLLRGEVPSEIWSAYVEHAQLPDACRHVEPTSLLIVPLTQHDQIFGVIGLIQHSSSRRPIDEDVTLVTDLASRIAAAIDNGRLYEALRESDRRKDEFLAMLGHELRNPLSPISNVVDLLEFNRHDPERVTELRDVLGRQVQQMTRLIDDLLDVARISRGRLKLRLQVTDLRDPVRTAIESMRPALDEAGHTLTMTIADQPMIANADPARVSQIVSNLLSNAAKFTPRGGRITAECFTDHENAVIRITDTGIGIPRAAKERIFEMFSQIDAESESSHTGLGIGLALVRTLVELHGGAIEVESAGLNRGSTFTVRLGLTDATLPEHPAPSEQESEKAPDAGYRVLVVEDHAIVAELFGELLEEMGHRVEIAASGEEALARVAHEDDAPDVVFSDISMVGMSGYELGKTLRANPKLQNCVLVAVTGFGQDADRRRALDAGFDYHLVKPVDGRTLERFFSQLPELRNGAAANAEAARNEAGAGKGGA